MFHRKLKNMVKPVVLPLIFVLIEKGPLARLIRNWNYPFKYLHEVFLLLRDLFRYSRMEGAEPIRLVDLVPVFFQRNVSVRVDAQYFHAHIWALSRLLKIKPDTHVDVASSYGFVGMLGCLMKVRYVEYNPPVVSTEAVEIIMGDLLALPFEDDEVNSLSCIHAAEHVGLGRYGDSLDPLGTRKAAAELWRVLAGGGNLFFAIPVGRPRVQFNGLRVHSSDQITEYFSGLELVEYCGVDDEGRYRENLSLDALDGCSFGCGFFHFRKPVSKKPV